MHGSKKVFSSGNSVPGSRLCRALSKIPQKSFPAPFARAAARTLRRPGGKTCRAAPQIFFAKPLDLDAASSLMLRSWREGPP